MAIKYLFDGAFGTYYAELTGSYEPCEYGNVSDPKAVERIHREYIAAGADAIKTNTFGANKGLCEDEALVNQIIAEGYRIAREAAKDSGVEVFADIGPVVSDSKKDAAEETIRVADVFLGLGADKFLLETLPEAESALKAAEHIKRINPKSYIIVSFAVGQDGYTKAGKYYKNLLEAANGCPYVDAVGLNCICGPYHLSQLIKGLKFNKDFSVMPNSGYPQAVGNRVVYLDNARYFSRILKEMAEDGVTILGGCCGTTPEHIRATKERLQKIQASPKKEEDAEAKTDKTVTQTAAQKNTFAERLNEGGKVIAVELDTPSGFDISNLIESAKQIKSAGADAVTIADSPLSRAKADTFLTAARLMNEADVTVLPHLTCRDRNIIAIKAQLLGGKMHGIHNVFVITGDPIVKTERTDTKGVFDFNSMGLIEYIKSLNENVFSGQKYLIGAALNLNAVRFCDELNRARKKIQKGAEYFMTQPIFNEDGIENLKAAHKELGTKVLAGIMPPVGYKNAVFLNNEVSGIKIPQDLIQSLKETQDGGWEKVSLDFCKEIIDKAFAYCDGFYIVTQRRRADLATELVKYIRSK